MGKLQFMNTVSEMCMLNKETSDTFCMEQIKIAYSQYITEIKNSIPWDDMDEEIAAKLGFKKYMSDSECEAAACNVINDKEYHEDLKNIWLKRLDTLRYLYLIPVYLYPAIPEKMELIRKDSDIIIFKLNETSAKSMNGFLEYGILIK